MSIMNRIILAKCKKSKTLFDISNLPDYKKRREEETKQALKTKLPSGVEVKDNVINGVKVQILCKTTNPRDRIILYIHGGGFVGGSPKARWEFIGRLCKEADMDIVAVDYRLAPEHPFPAAPEDCFAVYTKLLEQYEAENIILMGESAGANLVFVLLLMIKDNVLPMPRLSVAYSPCVQFDTELNSYSANYDTEGMLTNFADEVKAVYLCDDSDEQIKNPYLAPLYGDFRGCTDVIMFASNSEYLYDDSMLMYNKLKEDKVNIRLYIRKGMIHTWNVIPTIPEAAKDMKLVIELIHDALKGKGINNSAIIYL